MTDKGIACPDCEEGTLQYQPEEWEGGERPALQYPEPVSYTHLTLPTNREV